jgi:hypothetical protein
VRVRQAEVAEDDVLDALREEGVPVRHRLRRLLADEVEDHGEVVHAERPEGVLVLADLAEVLPVPVDAENVAELTRLHELLELADAGVVEEEVAGHQHELVLLGEPDELLHLSRPHRGRLLHEDVLAGLERPLRELVVRRHRRRDDHGVELVVGQQLVEVGREPGARIARPELRLQLGRDVAQPHQLREVVEVAGEVRAPVAEPGLANANAHR